MGLGGHGVVDPLDLHGPRGDDSLDAGEGSFHQHRLHLQIEGQHRCFCSGGDGLYFISVWGGGEEDAVAAGIGPLDYGDNPVPAVFALVGEEFEAGEISAQFSANIGQGLVIAFSCPGLGNSAEDGADADLGKVQLFHGGDAHQVHIVDGIKAQVGVVAEKGLVIVEVVVFPGGCSVGKAGPTSPYLHICIHHQK